MPIVGAHCLEVAAKALASKQGKLFAHGSSNMASAVSEERQEIPESSSMPSGDMSSSDVVVDCPPPVQTEAFSVKFNNGNSCKGDNPSLQDAFKKYMNKKQKEIKRARKRKEIPDEARKRALADPERMWRLRMKFIKQLKKYFGIPYARKYWKPEDPEYQSPIFLDCCGLVRRVLRDLKKDFGFRLGPWNQAYMCDTLPITIEREEDMKPGDLVFISAIYYNPKTKKQRHNMTHVEIWLGEGEKTIGARWQKGKVQIFDSYRFTASSYHSEKYIFKSIDTWLMGICRSHCSLHRWKMRSEIYKPEKKSIFSLTPEKPVEKQQEALQDVEDESAGDTDDDLVTEPDTDPGIRPAEQLIQEILRDTKDREDSQNDIMKRSIEDEDKELGELVEQELDELVEQFGYLGTKEDRKQSEGIGYQRTVGDGDQSESEEGSSVYEDEEDSASEIGVEGLDSDSADNKPPSADLPSADENITHVALVSPDDDSSQSSQPSQSNSQQDAKMMLSYNQAGWKQFSPRDQSHRNSIQDAKPVEKTCVPLSSPSSHTLNASMPADRDTNTTPLSQTDSLITENNITLNSNNNNRSSDESEEETAVPITAGGYVMQSRFIVHPSAEPLARSHEEEQGHQTELLPSGDSEDNGAGSAGCNTSGGRKRDGRKGKDKDGSDKQGTWTNRPRLPLSYNKEPTFYIGGGNGVTLVESALQDLGWKRITDKNNETFKLKWVECKSQINYQSFKEGDQLVNRIPNCYLLTNKLGLLNSLQRYERVQNSVVAQKYSRIKSGDFLPLTYRIDDPNDRKIFLESHQDGEIWICKPTGLNQGKGIYLVRDLEEFKKTLEERDEKKQKTHRPAMDRIVQRYITNPLLLEGRKFDIRAYMLIASTMPYLVLYHKGYVRLCLHEYDNHTENLTAHLTNQFIQKKDAEYQAAKENTAWSMDKFNDYINENLAEDKGLEKDWVYNTLTARMKQIMTYCFKAVHHKLKYKIGYFDLYGLDFMVDEDMKVWLIEINANPCLATNCEALKEVVPGVAREAIYLALECFEKQKRNKQIMPLDSQQNFQLLFSESSKSYKSQNRGGGSVSPTRGAGVLPPVSPRPASPYSRSLSPPARTRSISPVKEMSTNNNTATPSQLAPTQPHNAGLSPAFKPSPRPSLQEPAVSASTQTAPQAPALQQSSPAKVSVRGTLPSLERRSAGNYTNESQDNIRFMLTHTMLRKKRASTPSRLSPPSIESRRLRAEKAERQTLALRTISAKYSSTECMDKGAALSPSPTPGQSKQNVRPQLTGKISCRLPKSPATLITTKTTQGGPSITPPLVPSISTTTTSNTVTNALPTNTVETTVVESQKKDDETKMTEGKNLNEKAPCSDNKAEETVILKVEAEETKTGSENVTSRLLPGKERGS